MTKTSLAHGLSRDRLAVHEAGHVVADLEFLFGFLFVTIEEGAGCVGATNPMSQWDRDVDGPKSDLATEYAMSLYAGAAAEEVFFGSCSPWYDDFDLAESVIAEFVAPPSAKLVGDSVFVRFHASLRDRARQLIRRRRVDVRRVADELLTRGRLSEQEVESLLASERASGS